MEKRKEFLKLLIEKGITQVELAKRIGVSFQSLNLWISGKRNPSLKSIDRLSKELGLTNDDIIKLFLKTEKQE